jgi:uncharacterized protein YndB with AHSA1/START domain
MSGADTQVLPGTDCEINLMRVVDATPELVWKVWTDAEHLAHWWGPDGFSITTSEFNFRVGGLWKFVMHGPDGRDYKNWIRYTEIVEAKRICNEHGGDDDRVQFLATITFEPQGEKTRVTMSSTFPDAKTRTLVVREYGAIEGGQQTLGRLADYMATL